MDHVLLHEAMKLNKEPSNKLKQIGQHLADQTHTEQMLAGHKMNSASGKAQRHQNGIIIGHMVADDQRRHIFPVRIMLKSKDPLKGFPHQMP